MNSHVLLNSICPNLSFPHATSGNPLLISSRFQLKDCRNDKNRGISGQTLFVFRYSAQAGIDFI